MYFCIKKDIETQGEVCRQLIFLPLPPPPPPVVYATDRSKAVVPVLSLFCIALWFILQALLVLKSCRALCPILHSFSHCDHLACGIGSWSVCFSFICLFVLYVLDFVIFLLVSGVGCGL